MTTRSFILSIVTTAIVFGIGGRCTAPAALSLPAKTQARVVRSEILNVIDSAAVLEAKREADRERRRADALSAGVRRADSVARLFRTVADELAADVVHARTAADSAIAWRRAYEAEAVANDSLESGRAKSDSIITAQRRGWAATDSALSIQAGHASRSDSLIAELLPLAQRRDHCSVLFGAIKCPTRKQALVGGVVIGAGTVAVLSGKVRIRIPLPF